MPNIQGIKNKEDFKELIQKYLTFRKTKKRYKFYKVFVNSYQYHKEDIEKIIINFSELGYWKDYLMILIVSKDNKELQDFIYKFLLEEFKKDVQRYNNHEKITTLAKWMPREGNSFDKRLNFVDIFSKMLFPDLQEFTRKKKYRQIVSKLCDRINIIERQLCAKDYEGIDFENLPLGAFRSNYKNLIKHEQLLPKVKNYIKKYYESICMNLFFLKLYNNHEKYDDIYKEVINSVFNGRKKLFYDELCLTDDVNIDNNKGIDIIIRLDKDIFNEDKIIKIISYLLVLREFHPINIIVSTNDPFTFELEGDLMDMIYTIVSESCQYKYQDLNKLSHLIKYDNLIMLNIPKSKYIKSAIPVKITKYEKPNNLELINKLIPNEDHTYLNTLSSLAVIFMIFIVYYMFFVL